MTERWIHESFTPSKKSMKKMKKSTYEERVVAIRKLLEKNPKAVWMTFVEHDEPEDDVHDNSEEDAK